MCGDVDLLQGKEAQMGDKQKSELRNEQSEETKYLFPNLNRSDQE